MPPLRSLVVTADDFGLAGEVNEAVEIAHRDGILTAASLMVAEPACADAVERARRLPGLAVGLHLSLVEGRAVLPRSDIPNLLDTNGRLRSDLARYGAAIFFRPDVKRQVEAEIRAQFEAYRRTGLRLDHVNAHKHYHLHPTIAALVVRVGREYGMAALRVPVEPESVLRAVEPVRPGIEAQIAGPYAKWLRRTARGAGLVVADQVFGLAWSGGMTTDRVAGLLRNLPPGRTEIYAHPAIRGGFEGAAPGYRYAEELAALTAQDARAALKASGARTGGCSGWSAAV